MTLNIDDIIASLPADRQAKIEARAAELIAEEMALQDLRKARKFTHVRMAELLNMRQDNISQIEHHADLLISTFQSYIAAMGGELSLLVEFKDRSPVKISGLASIFEDSEATEKEYITEID